MKAFSEGTKWGGCTRLQVFEGLLLAGLMVIPSHSPPMSPCLRPSRPTCAFCGLSLCDRSAFCLADARGGGWWCLHADCPGCHARSLLWLLRGTCQRSGLRSSSPLVKFPSAKLGGGSCPKQAGPGVQHGLHAQNSDLHVWLCPGRGTAPV